MGRILAGAGDLSLLQNIQAGSGLTQAPSHLGPVGPPWEESGQSVKLITYRLVLRLKIYIQGVSQKS